VDIWHNSLSRTIWRVICHRLKDQAKTAPRKSIRDERPFQKVIEGFQDISTTIMYVFLFHEKGHLKPKIDENWKDSFLGGYLRFRGTKLSSHHQWDILRHPLTCQGPQEMNSSKCTTLGRGRRHLVLRVVCLSHSWRDGGRVLSGSQNWKNRRKRRRKRSRRRRTNKGALYNM